MSEFGSMEWIFEQEDKLRKDEIEQKLKKAKRELEMETFNACVSIAVNNATLIAIASALGGCDE